MKILIVDDIEENLYLLETLLKGSGYEVVTAKDGVEALQKIKKETIDMIISDILMPRMDGFQFCRECKKDESLKKIPFIFYTATYTDKEDENFALSLGAERFIIKPQEPEIFLKIFKEVIEEYKGEVIIAPQESIQAEEIYLSEYNKRLIEKLEKNEERYRELFTHMSSGVIIYEAKGNGRDFIIKNINPAVEKIDKLKKENVLGKSIFKVFPGVKHFDLLKALQKVYKNGKPQRLTISLYLLI
jgi:CheY-like chemotaxis protein